MEDLDLQGELHNGITLKKCPVSTIALMIDIECEKRLLLLYVTLDENLDYFDKSDYSLCYYSSMKSSLDS